MTEREFDRRVEEMGARFERRIDASVGLGAFGLAAEIFRIVVFRRKK